MIHYDVTATIDRPASEVFDWLADPVRMDQWTTMTDGRWLSGAPGGPGAVAESAVHLGPISSRLRWTVTDYVPGRRIGWTTLPGGPMQWTGSYDLTTNGSSTVVRSVGDVQPTGLFRILEPIIRSEIQRNEAAEMVKLQHILELSPQPAPQS
jgi:hypothetical protein